MMTYLRAKKIELVKSGNNFFDVLEQIIEESVETLHLQTYIFENDQTGKRIIKALKSAAARKVKVYMLVDAIGSFSLPDKEIKALQEAGVYVRKFSPLFSSESIFVWRRLHHKIIVADKNTGIVGGINIADKYNRTARNIQWLDYAIYVKGSVCEYLHLVCEQTYHKQKTDRVRTWVKLHEKDRPSGSSLIRFRRNDWLVGKNEIHSSYIEALKQARHSVIMLASYFLPGLSLRNLLKQATAKGVDVKIILAGKSDVTSVLWAESYLYDFYLRHNIQIYNWGKSVMHAKVMIVDGQWATIGSYNLNALSRYMSIELNADIKDKNFLEQLSSHLNDIVTNHCVPVKAAKLRKKVWYRQFVLWLAYYFYKLLGKLLISGKPYRERSRPARKKRK